MHAYPHVPHGYTHAMFGRCDVDLNSCIPTLGYLPPPAAVRQISAAKAPHRVIGPLVHHALTVGPYAFLFLVHSLPALGAKGGRVGTKKIFIANSFYRDETALKPPSKAAQAIVASACMLGSGLPGASRTPSPFVPLGLLRSTSNRPLPLTRRTSPMKII